MKLYQLIKNILLILEVCNLSENQRLENIGLFLSACSSFCTSRCDYHSNQQSRLRNGGRVSGSFCRTGNSVSY